MAVFARFDPEVHSEEFSQLNIETLTWHSEQLQSKYQIDTPSDIGQSIVEYVEEHLEDLTSFRPPSGMVYLLLVDSNIAGMGAIKRLNDGIGEIQRMYIRSNYRGRGFGKKCSRYYWKQAEN